jgi:5-methylcytosine-specific restriction endonuclease McrBC GTP-binding regulatory subunit McrB
MTIPEIDQTTLPLLELLKDGKVHSVKESANVLADVFNLTDEEKSELRKEGKSETKILDKVRWSRSNLKICRLIEDVLETRDQIRITPRGTELLNENPPALTDPYLRSRFPEYAERKKHWKLNKFTNFIKDEMRTEYNYQPAMILSLLKCPNFTASRSLIREQFKRYNQFVDKDFAEPLREAIIATTETKDRNIISELNDDKIKLNLESLDQESKNKLIDICYERIADWDSKWILSESGIRESIPDSSQIYLLQVSEKGSKEILENKYLYENWANFESNKRDRVYGDVKSGDFVLIYFTNSSLIHSKMVKMVYTVSDVSDDHVELKLIPVKQLTGVHLDTVRKNRDSGILGEKFNLIGQSGNITKISRQDYLDMITLDYKSKISIDENIFSNSKSIVEKTMDEKKKFTNLIPFLNDKDGEGYKGEILEKAEKVLKEQTNIVEKLKIACSQKIVGGHLFRFNGGEEASQAKILYVISKESKEVQEEFEHKLSDFFECKTEMEFGNRWDSLVSTMKSIKSTDTSPEFLFLSYLAFLQNLKLHIPFTTTKADTLFQFFELDNEKISNNKDGKNWHNYSTLLELTNELKLKLADHPDLELIDVQGFMWILANEIKKEIKVGNEEKSVDDSIDTTEFEGILEHKSQMILYGPPGTGKTFTAKKIAESFTGKGVNDVQLHNQCFLALGGWNNWGHTIQNGPLRWGVDPSTPSNLGVYNSVKEGDYVLFYQNKDEPVKFTKRGLFGIGRVTRKYTSEEPYWPDEVSAGNAIYTHRFEMESLKIADNDNEMIPWIEGLPFTKGLNSIKNEEVLAKLLSEIQTTWNLSLGCSFIKKITFHQSFSYEEFIEGIKAEAKGTSVSFNVEAGIFKEFCNCAKRNPKQKFVMIIDEINRGNISKILGELITLLEKDKRGDTATLPYSKESFHVPENVYVIGTMNTADRSLVLLDVALRRRFAFYEIMPDPTLLKNQEIGNINLTKLLTSINEKILKQDNMRDYQIGHSYFMKGNKAIESKDDLHFAMVYEVIPLVKEYFYNEQEKANLVLGSDLASSESGQAWRKKSDNLITSLETAFPDSKVKRNEDNN